MNEEGKVMETEKIVFKKKRYKIKGFDIINIFILTLFALLCLYPFFNQLMISFATKQDFYAADLFVWPKHFNFDSYKFILYQDRIGYAFLVSLFVTVVGTAYNMALTILGAYVLTKKTMPGRGIFFAFILITMFFGGGLIPFYLTIKEIGLIDNIFSVILPFGINSFNMIILRNFFNQVPESMVESCKLDGAGEFTILTRFILPLSKAGLATIGLFYVVERWNDWYWPMMFLSTPDWFPLSLELRNILSNSQSTGIGGGGDIDPGVLFEEGKQSAMIVISMIPILMVYPFVQKYFVKGVMIGSVKD